jgi:hypothetical protein
LPQDNLPAPVLTDNVEGVFTDIDADYGNRSLCCCRHGVLLVLAAGQEHGRTIPLTDIVLGL